MIEKCRSLPIEPRVVQINTRAIICGANIKPFATTTKVKDGILGTIKDWGIFVHFRLPNGNQLDGIWKLESSVTNALSTIPRRKVGKNHPIPVVPAMPIVLRACGVNEFVDLIGVEVKIKQYPGYFKLSSINEIEMQWFTPDFYEFHDNQNP